MNRTNAVRIAESITRDQLGAMFANAKASITDWTKACAVNPQLSLGATWNIMYPVFVQSEHLRYSVIKNMVWAFGDYLDDSLKPAKAKPKLRLVPHHEEPIFEVPA